MLFLQLLVTTPLVCLKYLIWLAKDCLVRPHLPSVPTVKRDSAESLIPSPPSQMRCSRKRRPPFQLLPGKNPVDMLTSPCSLSIHFQNVTTKVVRAGCALGSTLHWVAVQQRAGFFVSATQINLHVPRKKGKKTKQTHNQKT